MDEVNSLSLLVGKGVCNANCTNCAGLTHRQYAPRQDGIVDTRRLREVIEECYSKGARSLTISSSGEPLLSPVSITKVLILLMEYADAGQKFSTINLYTNGILIGENSRFAYTYLRMWKLLGLTKIHLTVHSPDEIVNAKLFGISCYPSLVRVIYRIQRSGLHCRVNLVLEKSGIHTLEQFKEAVVDLRSCCADSISAWPLRSLDGDTIHPTEGPSKIELEKMRQWTKTVDLGIPILVHRDSSNDYYNENKKLTLFSDGTLSNSWCK